jgi:hypothetical protein
MLDPMEKYLKIKVLWSSILEKIRYFQSTSHAFLFHDHLELLEIISQNVNIYQIEVYAQIHLIRGTVNISLLVQINKNYQIALSI